MAVDEGEHIGTITDVVHCKRDERITHNMNYLGALVVLNVIIVILMFGFTSFHARQIQHIWQIQQASHTMQSFVISRKRFHMWLQYTDSGAEENKPQASLDFWG